MERPKITPDNISEHKDRRMELMEERHRNAIMAFRLEQFLSKEEPLNGEYPTSRTAENKYKIQASRERLKPILDKLEKAGLITKRDRIELAVDKSIQTRIMAQRAELELEGLIEQSGQEVTPEEMGLRLFSIRMGKHPKGKVEALRWEGYFQIACFDDEDYKDLSEDTDKDESGGRFHQKMKFGSLSVDTILIRHGWINSVAVHERQHFINGVIFSNFEGFEQHPSRGKDFPFLYKGLHDYPVVNNIETTIKLNNVKDELLARIRDGSDPKRSTDFFELELYKYLRNGFSPDEGQEVGILLSNIESELKNMGNVFDYPSDARAILVYHLIDIPLLKFPERIKAVADFIKAKIKEFTDFIPDEDGIITFDPERLGQLKMDMTGEAYGVVDTILGIKDIEASDAEEELKAAKERLILLRKEYDQLMSG